MTKDEMKKMRTADREPTPKDGGSGEDPGALLAHDGLSHLLVLRLAVLVRIPFILLPPRARHPAGAWMKINHSGIRTVPAPVTP
jgi:hypothetical protein